MKNETPEKLDQTGKKRKSKPAASTVHRGAWLVVTKDEGDPCREANDDV